MPHENVSSSLNIHARDPGDTLNDWHCHKQSVDIKTRSSLNYFLDYTNLNVQKIRLYILITLEVQGPVGPTF